MNETAEKKKREISNTGIGNCTKYLDVRQSILTKISSGKLSVGDKLPSRIQLTSEYGISDSTCKKVLYSLMQEKVLEGSQGKGVFVRSPVSVREVKKLAFIIWKGGEILNHPAFSQTAFGIIHGAADLEHQLIFTFIDPLKESRSEIERKIYQTDARDFIFSYIPSLPEDLLLPIIERKIHVITLGWKLKHGECFSITDDLGDAIYRTVLHFLDSGIHDIAYVGSPAKGLFERRLMAFTKAFAERSISLKLSNMKKGREQTSECGENLCGELLKETVPAVIFADDDNICSGVLSYLKNHGLDAGNVKVVRIGGWESGMHCSTISIPWRTMGKAAADLINQLDSGRTPAEKNIIIPCEVSTL